MLAKDVLTEEWLADVLQDSMEMDWTTTDGARAIMRALERGLVELPQSGGQIAALSAPSSKPAIAEGEREAFEAGHKAGSKFAHNPASPLVARAMATSWAEYTTAIAKGEREDDFRGDNAHLVCCINALLDLDDAKALVPHGMGKGSHAYRLLAAASARLAALAQSSTPPASKGVEVPAGWKLVPVEPTPDMIEAGRGMFPAPAYRAMVATVAAAPTPSNDTLQGRGEVAPLTEAATKAEDAMREMFRYFDGGETRGSYDGKPERNGLRTAWYALRAALQKDTRHVG